MIVNLPPDSFMKALSLRGDCENWRSRELGAAQSSSSVGKYAPRYDYTEL